MSNQETPNFPNAIKCGDKCLILRCPMDGCPYHCRTYKLFSAHVEEVHFCSDCGLYCTDNSLHQCKRKNLRGGHVDSKAKLNPGKFKEYSRAHLGTIRSFLYKVENDEKDIRSVFSNIESDIQSLLSQLLEVHTSLFVDFKVAVHMQKDVIERDELEHVNTQTYFKSDKHSLHSSGEISSLTLASVDEIIEKKNEFVELGSGWYVKRIESVEIKVGELRLFSNSKGSGYIKTPVNNKGIMNFRVDTNCFMYSIAAGLHWKEVQPYSTRKVLQNPRTWEKFFHLYDFSDLNGEVDVYNDIPTFEDRASVNINVFSHRGKQVVLIRQSNKNFKKVVNLFLIHSQVSNRNLYHFALIYNVDKFLANGNDHKSFFCQYCFRHFKKEQDHAIHLGMCRDAERKDDVYSVFPDESKRLEFTRPEYTLPWPYVGYYDFETASVPVSTDRAKKGDNTTLVHEFVPVSYSLVIIRQGLHLPRVVCAEYYDGPDVVNHFFERVFDWGQRIIEEIRRTNNKYLPTQEELRMHEAATHCKFSNKKFISAKELRDNQNMLGESDVPTKPVIKTFHHDHTRGTYIGAVAQDVNLRIKYKHEFLLVAHNSSSFDHHLLVKAFQSKLFATKDIHVIAKSSEKFIQVTLTAKAKYLTPLHNPEHDISNEEGTPQFPQRVKLRFIDSFNFLHASLSSLTANLVNENSKFLRIVEDGFAVMLNQPGRKPTKEDIGYLMRKLDFPYSYLTSAQTLEKGYPMPPRQFYDNEINNTKISDSDWELVQEICNRFNINDFKSYTRLYCLLDSLLLASCFENFRYFALKHYGLDPCYCSTASSFGWQCFLYMSRCKIDYIRDPEMLRMVNEGTRGGCCFTTMKYLKANNERTPDGFDPKLPRTHLACFDLNAMYSHAMIIGKFPTGNFEWVNVQDLERINWMDECVGEDGTGYFLKVNLKYPHSLHDYTKDMPLAPQRRMIHYEEFSSAQKAQFEKLGGIGKSYISNPKLLLDCSDKIEYVLHYTTLRYYLKMGMKLEKIICGFKFTQDSYFKDFVLKNMELRKHAKFKTEKDMLKLLCNSCYGYSLLDVRNRVEVKFCRSRAEALEYISSPRIRDFIPIKENLSLVMLKPKKMEHTTIRQTGNAILEISKQILYQGFYEILKGTFGERVRLAYTDTDSYVAVIRDDNNTFLDDIVANREHFDFSKLHPDSDIFKRYPQISNLSKMNECVAGKLKIESINISEGVFLRPKMYSLRYFTTAQTEKQKSDDLKARGLPSRSLNNTTLDTYKSVVLEDKLVRFKVRSIRAINHSLYSIVTDRVGFHSLDTGRVFLPTENDLNNSLPFFHHNLYNCKCFEE